MPYNVVVSMEESKQVEIIAALLYNLQDKLEFMQAQLGYIKTLNKEIIIIWANGNKIEKNRKEWIEETEIEISKCQAHINALK